MKKRFISGLLALTVAVSSLICMPAYARYTSESNEYTYRSTTDLEAEIDGEKIVLTWPAVDTSGKLINANPLKADGQQESTGNPTAGWTNPTQGMIIEYSGWLPDGTHNTISSDNKTTHNILYGVTDKKTDYPIVIVDPRTSEVVKTAYVDTTVVATSLATGYMLQYSTDGVNWVDDHEVSEFRHGKKLCRLQADGVTKKDDNKNTFFLEDQITEALTTTLSAGTKYYLRVIAYDKSLPSTKNNPYHTYTAVEITTPAAKELTPAFPSVEGSGKYSQGGRGTQEQPGDVYVVTNLTDSVSNPQPGSLRYGLERRDRADGNKSYPRTIVFAVGGTIKVDESAAKSARRFNITDNTTIAGQTAPGEGITLYGASVKFSGKNIIARYLRVRLGEGYDQDAATASGENIVIDHCTFNWGVDECFTAKELINSSIQYNIVANSLSMVNKNGDLNSDVEVASGESEAKHGMGSIINGYETTFTHNLYANNGTRNPRFEGQFSYNNVNYTNKLEFSNNVIYNWGHNTGYGGERGKGEVNFIANYHKAGPNTLEKVKNYIFDADGVNAGSGVSSSYYFADNVLEGNAEVTADNTKGVKDYSSSVRPLSSKLELTTPYTEESAAAAYEKVLNEVGASFARDAQDARLIYNVKNGLGGFINSEFEDGGVSNEVYTSNSVDSDSDGMPDEWEVKMGLNKNDKSDAGTIITDEASPYYGYSNIEVYINDILGEWDNAVKSAPEAPVVNDLAISSAALYTADLSSASGTIVQGVLCDVTTDYSGEFDVYLNEKVVAHGSSGKAEFTPSSTGRYNLAIKTTGTPSILSNAIPVTVIAKNAKGNLAGFTSADIGEVRAAGSDSFDSTTGKLVSQGAGHIGILATSSIVGPDAFHYNYRTVKGDFTFTSQVDNLAKIDYYQHSGLMVRSSLDPNSEFYMASLTYLKGEDYEGMTDVTGQNVKAKNIRSLVRTSEGSAPYCTGHFMGVAQKKKSEEPNHGWARLTREGQTITISASLDGSTWYDLDSFTSTLPDTCYIGFATDAAQDSMDYVRTNATEFTNISLETASIDINTLPEATMLGDTNCDGTVTAADAALMLSYVLAPERDEITAQGLANGLVTDSRAFTSANAAEIMQKVLNSSYTFSVLQ